MEMILENSALWSAESVADAKGLLSAIIAPDFLASWMITKHIFGYTANITRSWQCQSRDIVEAVSGLNVLCDSLQSVREDVDTHHRRWISEIQDICKDAGVEFCIPRLCRRQQHRDNIPAETPDKYYKRNISIPLLDHVLAELKFRFSSHQRSAMFGLCFVPASMVFLKQEEAMQKLEPVISLYKDDLPYPETVWSELHCWFVKWHKELLRSADPISFPKSLSIAIAHASEQLFLNVKTLLTILCILPVTSCSSERGSSALKMIKTRLRSTMTDERLTGLILMSIHRDIHVCVDEVITEFSIKHRRRLELEHLVNSQMSD